MHGRGLQRTTVLLGSKQFRQLLPVREQEDAQDAVRQPGHADGRALQGAAPMKRRPVMGPALLPAGATLSMLRWSLSFTA